MNTTREQFRGEKGKGQREEGRGDTRTTRKFVDFFCISIQSAFTFAVSLLLSAVTAAGRFLIVDSALGELLVLLLFAVTAAVQFLTVVSALGELEVLLLSAVTAAGESLVVDSVLGELEMLAQAMV